MDKVLNSKYIQSDLNDCFINIRNKPNNGKLFSGSPCQIAGLKQFLKKQYDNLYTIDIICYGVPSILFFNEYVKILENKYNKEIINITFRDKRKGWEKILNVFLRWCKNNSM